jgi:hypothetical protein
MWYPSPALDAIFLYQILGIAHKPDVSTPGSAHHPNLSHMLYGCRGCRGRVGYVCRGGRGVLDAVGAGKESGGAGGNSAGAGICKYM